MSKKVTAQEKYDALFKKYENKKKQYEHLLSEYKYLDDKYATALKDYDTLLQSHSDCSNCKNDLMTQECEVLKEKIRIKDDENSNLNKKYRQEQVAKFSYRKALKEIEGIIQAIMETNRVYPLKNNLAKILNIINKAKGEGNEY